MVRTSAQDRTSRSFQDSGKNKPDNEIFLIVEGSLLTIRLLNNITVTFDRFYAIKFPFHYEMHTTPNRVTLLILGIYLF